MDFLDGLLRVRVAIGVRGDDALEALRVDNWLDVRLVVAHQIVVQLDATGLLRQDHDVANLEENAFHL